LRITAGRAIKNHREGKNAKPALPRKALTMTRISYKGWTITAAYVGFVATHDDHFDGETGEWQINADSVEEIKEEIDDRA